MPRLLALLLAASLLVSAGTALAAPEKRGKAPFVSGSFELSAGERSVAGDHVSFNYSDAGINDYRAGGRILFDVRVTGEPGEDDDDDDRRPGKAAETAKGQIRLRMPNFTFTAHDNPTAAAKLAADGLVEVSFAQGVVLAPDNGGGDRVRFTYGDVTGVLRAEDARIVGTRVLATDDVLVVLDAPRGPFETHRDLGRAIGKGHIGAEAILALEDDDGPVKDTVVSYGNVTMTTVKAERGNITVHIEGHGFEGRVIVLNIDGRILGADSAEKLEILLDNESVRPASNLTDILDPDDDGYHPEYYIVYDPGANAFQLIATVPHYSVHVLSVTTPFVLPPPSVTIGILAGLALLVPSALVLFRRK